MSVSLSRESIFMAKEELFRSRLSSYFISSFGAFPVHRGQLDRNAFKQAKKVLDNGTALIMFPEATRSKDGQLQTALPGSASIALQNKVSILPVGISGTEKMKGPFWMFRRPKVTVNIGRTFNLPDISGKVSKTDLAELTNTIMNQIAELLPPEQRGVYTKQEGTNDIKD